MTTVFVSAAARRPGTHVLVIGVGAYTYLRDGTEQVVNHRGLGQLTSPPVSAKAVIDWFLRPLRNEPGPGFRNDSAPLASLEGLIAAPLPVNVQSPTGPATLSGATRAEIRAAFKVWLDRVVADPGCNAILYFCGHGITAGNQYVLAQDVLKDEDVPWENGIDLTTTLFALERLATESHIHFWIDACREVEAELLLAHGDRPASLRTVDSRKATVRASVSALQATAEGRVAFGKAKATSRFTHSLLTALSGYCGNKRPGTPWLVESIALAEAIALLLERENKTLARRQSSSQLISGVSAPLVELGGPPKVKVTLDLLPDDLRHDATLHVRRPGAANGRGHSCAGGAVQMEVDKGYYDVGAESGSGAFQAKWLAYEEVVPPVYDYVFEVRP